MDGTTSLALGIKETEERDTIACPVCKGSGKILKSEILKAFGGGTLKTVLEGGMEEFIKKLNLGGLEVFRRINEEEEARWKEKISTLEKQRSDLTTAVEQKEREFVEKEKLAVTRGSLEAQRRAEEEKTGLTQSITELKVKINNIEDQHRNQAERLYLDHRKEIEALQKRVDEMQEKEKELIQLREKLAKGPSEKGKAGELEFREFCSQFAEIECSEKLDKQGDYLIKVRELDAKDNWILINEPILVDVKDKERLSPGDEEKAVRDARARQCHFVALVVADESQLRKQDEQSILTEKEGVVVMKTYREVFPRDMQLLRPLLKRYYEDGKRSDPDENFEEKYQALRKRVMEEINKIGKIREHTRKIRNSCNDIENIEKNVREKVGDLCGA
jgi:hypothetical protein